MSIIHVNSIKSHITRLFEGKIDLKGVSPSGPDRENHFLTRALAAYSIHFLSGCEPDSAAQAITDGGNDNGIDAIYYHEPERRLYLVQSKWIHDGSGEPQNGDIKKFIAGIKDLVNHRFERFNGKIKALQSLLTQVLNTPQSTYAIVVVYTGINTLATPSSRDLEDLKDEMNDASEILKISVLNQTSLHASLTARLAGDPINHELGLKSWGKVDLPYLAYYGQISCSAIGDLWAKHGERLFKKNLRGLLGETEVNNEIQQTLKDTPEVFWFFNNGITIISKKVAKTMSGGGATDFGTFHCEDISIVNGAQTVSTIGRVFTNHPEYLEKAYVPIRLISLENADINFGENITKTNNRQNKIENRDFVTLDPWQSTLREELGVDGISYSVIRSETSILGEKAFDLVEATTALACASNKMHLVVQLKREIGKLWEDITKAPYKELFNPSINSLYVWRCVQAQRLIDKELEIMHKEDGLIGRDSGIAIHGNRFISAMVFRSLLAENFGNPSFEFDQVVNPKQIKTFVRLSYLGLSDAFDDLYSNAIIPTLFKNMSKCNEIYKLTFVPRKD